MLDLIAEARNAQQRGTNSKWPLHLPTLRVLLGLQRPPGYHICHRWFVFMSQVDG